MLLSVVQRTRLGGKEQNWELNPGPPAQADLKFGNPLALVVPKYLRS